MWPLQVEFRMLRERLVDGESAAEERVAEALARERQAADRLTRLIEDQRPQRGLWARLTR